MSFNAYRENKILAKISGFTVKDSCSAHISMKFVPVINFRMPAIIGILKYMRRTNGILLCSE